MHLFDQCFLLLLIQLLLLLQLLTIDICTIIATFQSASITICLRLLLCCFADAIVAIISTIALLVTPKPPPIFLYHVLSIQIKRRTCPPTPDTPPMAPGSHRNNIL